MIYKEQIGKGITENKKIIRMRKQMQLTGRILRKNSVTSVASEVVGCEERKKRND